MTALKNGQMAPNEILSQIPTSVYAIIGLICVNTLMNSRAIVFVINKIIDWNVQEKDVADLKKSVTKLQSDVNAAHDLIRELKSNRKET